MKKEQLIELGLSQEQIEGVFKLNGLDVEAEKAKNKELEEQLKTSNDNLKERDKQLEDLKKVNPDELKATIESLKEANKQKDEQYAKEIKETKFNSALDMALTGAKAKNNTAVKAMLGIDLDTAEIDENGSIKGLNEKIEALRGTDGYLFDTTDNSSSNSPYTYTPSGTGGNTDDLIKSEIENMFK
ncbi:phage scaffolding protein [Peptostreptococcus faecalis]|uniref:phage scaffolding protein n=1 Tax=Peptostreptococcus faecalis TaxID=2045015 RepID=UPI000C7E5D3E|nr:phage scaffolding protein [Peptostreptococcus faecalis]